MEIRIKLLVSFLEVLFMGVFFCCLGDDGFFLVLYKWNSDGVK